MELARFKMRKAVYGDWWEYVTRSKNKEFEVGDDFLRRFFEFPSYDKLAELEISLYSGSAACRVSARVELRVDWKDKTPYPVIVLGDKSLRKLTGESIDRILKPLVGRRVHVQLEYIEKGE